MINERTEAIRGEYTQGVCMDGAAVLCDGEMITIEDIISRLRVTNDLLDHIDELDMRIQSGIEYDAAVQRQFDVTSKALETTTKMVSEQLAHIDKLESALGEIVKAQGCESYIMLDIAHDALNK